MAARVGVDVSPQAIDKRFTAQTATLLQQVLAACVQQVPKRLTTVTGSWPSAWTT